MPRYDLAIETQGHKDLVQPSSNTMYEYTYVGTGNGSSTWDDETQQVTQVGAGNGDYEASTKDYYEYVSADGSEYESYFDTVNIIFNSVDTKDKTIKMSINAVPSPNILTLQYCSDSNYVLNDEVHKSKQGQIEQTASFENGSAMRYVGTKQVVNLTSPINQRTGRSIKYRIGFENNVEDESSVLSMTTLTSGLIFDGDFNG